MPVAATGLWALLAPASFAADYPGLGLRWVAGDGLANEHLTRDMGALPTTSSTSTRSPAPWTA